MDIDIVRLYCDIDDFIRFFKDSLSSEEIEFFSKVYNILVDYDILWNGDK